MKNILLTLLVSFICGVLYRCGGSGNYPRQMRVVGIPTLVTLLLLYKVGFHWWLFAVFGMMIAAISTYWDFLFGEEKNWDNYWLHEFFIGISFFPIAIITGNWWLFALRSLFLAIAGGGLSKVLNGKTVLEEFMRGFIIPLSLLWV